MGKPLFSVALPLAQPVQAPWHLPGLFAGYPAVPLVRVGVLFNSLRSFFL